MRTSSEASPVSPLQPGQIRLLVVEDHRDTTRMLYLLLIGLGYAVKTAGDASAALELASQESFDILISDIGLPDETGYELMKQIHSRPTELKARGSGVMDGERLTCHLAGCEKRKSPPIDLEVQHSAATLQSHSRAPRAQTGERDGSGQGVPDILGVESHRVHAVCAVDSLDWSQ